ncbi:hypothetical protein [Arcicella rigui]|uniref:DUF922 domain-containing protein n=1 Tax=Arcicella rigui TaxID=797020 RepID=A0ABU5Q9N5_9BACT|nr:hypothetical protein [Arcicella rigui]MEA5139544.1 hypothetical protein [Arcicella rigui]
MKKYEIFKCFLLLIFSFFQFISPSVAQRYDRSVSIGSSNLKLKNSNFYIAHILDERTFKRRIGFVFNENKEEIELDVVGGLVKSSTDYLSNFSRKSTNAYPIVLKIKELKVSEKMVNNKLINGESNINLDFYYLRDTSLVHLTAFQSKITFTRSFGEVNHYDYLIGRLLEKAVIYFDKWMSANYDKNILLVKSLKLNIKPDWRTDNPVSGDTVFWSPNYQLAWKDFQGTKPPTSKYTAQVFTNFEYSAKADIKEGVLIIDVQFKTYMLKSSSWTTETISAYGLAHEQLHFDITKLVVERFKQKIRDKLTIEDYDSELQLTFIEMYREMNRLQKEYDAESNHSINFVGQQKWQSLVAGELRTIR